MQPLTIAVAQMRSTIGDVEGNAHAIERLLDRTAAEGARMLFLPEACLTGYNRDHAVDIALPDFAAAVRMVEENAQMRGVALSYGFVERDEAGGKPFVTQVLYDGNTRAKYRKSHLGPHERDAFQPGNRLLAAEIAGMRVGVQLCWEGHIPQIAATLRAQGAEVIAAPFASGIGGERRLESWNRFLPARASDNGVYVVACNALPAGGIAVYDPKGVCIASYAGDDEMLVTCEFDGVLPRDDVTQPMGGLSYFDYQRPELYEGA